MKEAIITISEGIFSNHENMGERRGKKFVSVDFEGFNEGSASPCDNEKEAQEQVELLLQKYGKTYKIKIIDKRIKEDLTRWF